MSTFQNSDCPICGNETNGLLITHHEVLKQGYAPEIQQGLIKCSKCTYSMCFKCLNLCMNQKLGLEAPCPAKCGAKLHPKDTLFTYGLDRSLEYAPFGLNRSLEYAPFGTEIWLGQDILEDQGAAESINLRSSFSSLTTKAQVSLTIDQLQINVDKMTISGRINIPILGDPFTVEFPIKLSKLSNPGYSIQSPNIVSKILLNHFKEEIKETFNNMNMPVHEINEGQFFETLCMYEQLDKTKLPDFSKSVFELGYLEYIKRVFLTTLNIKGPDQDINNPQDEEIDGYPKLWYQTEFGTSLKTVYHLCISNVHETPAEDDFDSDYDDESDSELKLEFYNLEESRAFFGNQSIITI